ASTSTISVPGAAAATELPRTRLATCQPAARNASAAAWPRRPAPPSTRIRPVMAAVTRVGHARACKRLRKSRRVHRPRPRHRLHHLVLRNPGERRVRDRFFLWHGAARDVREPQHDWTGQLQMSHCCCAAQGCAADGADPGIALEDFLPVAFLLAAVIE